ncbi:MAG: response regulator [Bacteroidetes bacterium]|nr:response regulator [Bacteroidota bacterium]
MNEEMKLIEVLLVEDDPQDVEITKEVMELSKVKLNVNVVGNGVEALGYLRKEDGYKDAVKPDLILLDLNMPKMNGREFLEEMKKDEHLKLIPVVVLTTSKADEDIVKTYKLGASCYVTKPVGLDQFQKVVQAVDSFWFTVVKYPPVK